MKNPWFNHIILRDLFWFLYLPWKLEEFLLGLDNDE